LTGKRSLKGRIIPVDPLTLINLDYGESEPYIPKSVIDGRT
jgi:hypothetical protein